MKQLFSEIKFDAEFIRGHKLQPGWYKIFKVFLLLGFIVVYFLLFGGLKTLTFLGVFLGLSLVVHMVYRIKTEKYTVSWMDFKVEEVDGHSQPTRIGGYYYAAVITNMVIALLISQILVK